MQIKVGFNGTGKKKEGPIQATQAAVLDLQYKLAIHSSKV
jgi:hypothetical protein